MLTISVVLLTRTAVMESCHLLISLKFVGIWMIVIKSVFVFLMNIVFWVGCFNFLFTSVFNVFISVVVWFWIDVDIRAVFLTLFGIM